MSENIEQTAVEKAEVKVDKADKPAKKTKKKSNKDKKRPFSEMISELKKVTWPTKDELRTYVVCVIVFVVVSALLLFAMEVIVTKLIDFLTNSDELPKYLIDWFGGN